MSWSNSNSSATTMSSVIANTVDKGEEEVHKREASPEEGPQDWKDMLRTTLRQPHPRQALSTLLFLLDTCAFIHAFATRGNDDPEQAMSSDDHEVLHQFYAYLCAMYIPPAYHGSTSSLPSAIPTPPFRVDLASLSPIAPRSAQSGDFTGSAEFLVVLRQAVAEAWGQCLRTANFSGQDHPQSTQIDQERALRGCGDNYDAVARDSEGPSSANRPFTAQFDASVLPEPNRLLQATLKRALVESQTSRASTPSTPIRPTRPKMSELPIDVGVQRWALSSLLHHYLGDDFGQIRQSDGVTSYARNEKDDSAIREYFPDPRRFSLAEAEILSPASDSNSLCQFQEGAIAVSSEDSKRDDKLTWLLGESVPSHTVRRRTPLSTATVGLGDSRPDSRNARMVARSPIAYQPRRRFMVDRDVLSDADLQEVVNFNFNKRPSSLGTKGPLTPPHRRAWSADSEITGVLRDDGDSLHDSISSQAKLSRHVRDSFETSSPGDWHGGRSLSRISSHDTYDSQSRLLTSQHRLSGVSTCGDSRLDTIEAGPSKHLLKPVAPNQLPYEEISNRPFGNLHIGRPSSESVRSEPAFPSSQTMPPTINQLSAQDKQNLVRKNRKLRAVLGEGIVDHHQSRDLYRRGAPEDLREGRYTVLEGQRGHAHSIDLPRSPVTGAHYTEKSGAALSRSRSVGSSTFSTYSRFSSTNVHGQPSQLSPIAASFVSDDGSITSPTAVVLSPLFTNADVARELRRRKLLKIQAFLGERVPASAILDVAGKSSHNTPTIRKRAPIFSKASGKLQRRLTKSKHSSGSMSDRETETRRSVRRALSPGPWYGESQSMDERSRSNSQTSDKGQVYREGTASRAAEFAATLRSRDQGSLRDPRPAEGRTDIGKAAEPVILAVRRARKLEKVFGSLPPAQMYARTNPRSSKLDARYGDDNMSIVSQTSRTSVHRARLASIRFIADSKDLQLIEDFARLVLSEESDASDTEQAGTAKSSVRVPRRKSSKVTEESLQSGIKIEDQETEEFVNATNDKLAHEAILGAASEEGSAGCTSRSSLETGFSHRLDLKSVAEMHSRSGLLGSSPSSSSGGLDLLHQRYDRDKSRRNRDSTLSGVTQHSSAASAYAVDGYGRPGRSQSRASNATSAAGTPRSSMESVRIQFKRAHKLATVFGTTRGEVFNRVLDDIEADIAEADDEEMDEEEKQEIIESVNALRASL